MNTREVATALRVNQWAGVMRERKESGLSIRRWCAEKAMNEKTFYYWQRKLREATCQKLLPHQKEELVPNGWAVCEEDTQKASEVTIEIGKTRIIATQATNLELLCKVCRVLSDAEV